MTQKHKLTKEELKTPDVFLTFSDHLLKKISEHGKSIGIVAAVLFVVGLLSVAVDQWQSYSERKAAAAIFSAESDLIKKRESVESESAKRLEEKLKGDKLKAPAPAKKEDETIDFDSTYGDLVSKVEDAIRKNAGSQAANVSIISLAGLYLQHKKFDRAAALLDQVKLGKESGTLGALLNAQRAAVAMETGRFEKAVAGYQAIVDDKQADFLHPDALVKIGLCYEKLKQLDQAREVYTRVSTEFGDSEAGKTAKGYLRLLELNGKG